MASVAERYNTLWNRIIRSWSQPPSAIVIPHTHVKEGPLGQPFQRNEHYFQVRINEMYLAHHRQWFSLFDPLVLVTSEFIYEDNDAEKVKTVPFVVGPMMIQKLIGSVPREMIFRNTRVAGLHPYRGGRLSLSVILCQVERKNYVRDLLQVVESVVSAFDFATVLSAYVKVASVVLDGVESLLGSDSTVPLVGLRKEFDPDAGDTLEPAYFALINIPDSQLEPDTLWVSNHQLLEGKSLETATPFRRADFVLYSISQTTRRTDVALLPFYQLYKQVVQDANHPYNVSWKSAKGNLMALAQEMLQSPDLTTPQASELIDQYTVEIKKLHDDSVRRSRLAPEKGKAPSEMEEQLWQTVTILDLK
jgi:hypothetical protein